jgi:CRISPR/Cas system endoribonuclease Cas6 (RAMP superfamily)
MGTVRFSIREEAYDEDRAREAAALLKMAELTNVGVRRTAGLGMIKFITLK